MAEEGKGKIKQFNWWKMQVEDYLYQKDLYLPLVGEKPEAMNASEWAILDRKVLATARLSLTPQVAFNISKEKTTAAVMKALEKLYEKPSASNKNNKQNSRRRSPTRGRSKSRGKSKFKGKTIVCWNCNKEGHKKNDCTEPKKKKGAGGRQGDDEGTNVKIREPHYGMHHKLGHLSESGMRILHSKNALSGMKNIQLDFCEGCVYGKQKRVSFRRDGIEKKIERLELVPTDVCGPTTVKSLGDDASRKTWIYAIIEKSDVYHTFKKWKALVENETGNKIKCLKYDNGGEYRDRGFQEYCSNNGIRLIRTVKRTHQENGLAERMNRTIMERARCMRIHADLPLQFWAAAVDTAVYLINRSPVSALNGGIPEEEW
ncbi:hypothetical protein RJ640_016809 [Escallonia rubra]|uniref:Retrovirus-related Pol polyprotein from transposon TNT 1-94 n=1 Tax=Escallonia rubra TaxID=112253 RepID=A0AA88QXR3_9ASTE|nr:hypothetical protein RJ640_016809 [Escallonia rubra]